MHIIPLDDCNLTNRVCNSVLPNKDVDGFTGASLGRLVQVLFVRNKNLTLFDELYDLT